MSKQTPLYRQHVQAGAQMVDFCGWEMPLHYGSQLEEHYYVRSSVGLFDVSHMRVVDVSGSDAYYFLRLLLANDIQKLTGEGRALYTCLLNEAGGVLEDLIVYKLADDKYRLVVNAGSRDRVLDWLYQQAERYVVEITERNDLAMFAIQGPDAINKIKAVLELPETVNELKPFRFCLWNNWMISYTGYTGEKGLEIILPQEETAAAWKHLLKAGVQPCGLGARDSLRLEAGLNLYGNDMDETTTPLESNLAWTVSWSDPERQFIGKEALQQQLQDGVKRQLVGLLLEQRGMMRAKQKVYVQEGTEEGEITSGGFSPTLGHSIALARIPLVQNAELTIDYRGKRIPVIKIKPPFVKQGQQAF